MNLNSILFPAPRSSYTIDSLKGELIWIPKYRKCTDSHSTSASSLKTMKTRSLSAISYEMPMMRNKQNISVASPDQKLKSKDICSEENSSVSDLPAKKPLSKPQLQAKTKSKSFIKVKAEAKKSSVTIKRRIPSLKLDLFELANQNNLQAKCKSEQSFCLSEQSEVASISSTNHKKNNSTVKNTTKTAPAKNLKYHLSSRAQLKVPNTNRVDECDCSQTSFDPNYIDEYGSLEQKALNTPRSLYKYPSKELSNPIVKGKLSARTIDSQVQPLPSAKLQKAFYSTITLCPATSEQHRILNSPMRLIISPTRPNTDLLSPRENSKENSFISARPYAESCIESSKTKPLGEVENYIPCLLLMPVVTSDKIVIYFHGNGEDINLSYELLSHMRDNLNINVIAIEYPGYGLYRGSPDELTIMQDSEALYEYLTKKLNVKPKNILLFGRSIGSGPATYLASQREVGALVLMSAFTSIRAVVKDFAGKWAQYLVKERFKNLEIIPKVKCPTFFIHGQRDNLIPFSHSQELHSVCTCASELILPKGMDHIEFDFFEDFSRPLIRFLQRCGIAVGEESLGKIRFPMPLFLPPEMVLKGNVRSKDALKKRDRSVA